MSAPLMYNTYTATCSSTAYTIGCRVRPFNLGFQQTEHLHNPLNEGKPVKICRDGQELPPDLGAQLCQLIEDAADKAGVPRPGTPKPSHSNSRTLCRMSMQIDRASSIPGTGWLVLCTATMRILLSMGRTLTMPLSG